MAKFDKDIPNLWHDRIRQERKFATPRHICCAHMSSCIPDPRKRRILRELHAVAKCMDEKSNNYDPYIIVLPLHSMLDFWIVFLKGMKDTPYEGKWFNLYITFPDLYPQEPPNIHFLSVPYHLNISLDGNICFDFLYHFYEPKLHMIDIIQDIKVLFIIPFIQCPLRIDALDDFMNNESVYMRKAKESAEKVGKNDYHEFLAQHSIIDDDVTDDFEIFFTDNIPPYMMSQISGKEIPKDKLVMASSGVYYDKDELKQLILSNKNPICVITGKILTEKIEDFE